MINTILIHSKFILALGVYERRGKAKRVCGYPGLESKDEVYRPKCNHAIEG